MGSFRREKDDEEDAGPSNAYQNLEKTSVLQETRTFNETPVNPRKCIHILTKILYLINQGEQLVAREATDCFFAMTKLFQSKDVVLRRMVYLGIKELSSIAEDVIIVTSSLTKDMTGKEDLYRAAAIRALCSITDNTMLQAVERYMKQCIVDKNAAVSCAALVSSLRLANTAGDVVKRWANEAQEALNSDNIMVQYHALGLLYHIRKSDRLAVSKLVNKLTRGSLKSPYAVCMLIRIACKLIEEEDIPSEELSDSPLFTFIESCLRHKSEMVIYEAAHAIVNLKNTNPRMLSPAFSILQLFCSSPKATLRFAAVRTLNKVAMTHPAAVTTCNLDLEGLITDSNRSVATLAITTLLKTGAESSVERLMKQISTFVAEISDEFKVVVVQAICALCTKYPRKHTVLMNFLSGMLREEGGLEYKTSIVDTIITIIEENADAKESGLSHLCEFIEDCEHVSLAVRILHLLGKEGPFAATPSKYIRFIYNRVILESPIVRAAAVTAMAQFGASCPALLSNILVLLGRCQMDPDDEVRDRATYYLSILNSERPELYKNYIIERENCSLALLEKSLVEHLNGDVDTRFDISIVPKAAIVKPVIANDVMLVTSSAPRPPKITREEESAARLAQLPGIQVLGPIHRSTAPIQLTESETEYTVQCIKHIFGQHVVFQFDCLNTLSDQILENVRVELTLPEGFTTRAVIPCPKLPYNDLQTTFVIVEFPPDAANSIATFGATLRFVVKDCDPNTGEPESEEGYDDEYMLEDLELTVADQIQKTRKNNFQVSWDAADSEEWLQAEDTFVLSAVTTLQDAVNTIVKILGLGAANLSENVPEGTHLHTLLCSGTFRGGAEILVRAKLALSEGVTLNLTVRSTDQDVAELITAAIG
uniref:Isoform A of Coatomer subunit gamma n=1 Tax=Drosophila melanogaster TaxID=7227 RepID=Q8I0G5-2|nr:coat protein (coatomer) gamma, isoform A [Drosophila melanogaster]AAF57160.1 coat protein (coatomer) gamma, isoform A [Drosophila melanogaster]|eukprot:NP_524608.1 coat protein (coatomer) gamma, isoform A [Drosophila melanogaster]